LLFIYRNYDLKQLLNNNILQFVNVNKQNSVTNVANLVYIAEALQLWYAFQPW